MGPVGGPASLVDTPANWFLGPLFRGKSVAAPPTLYQQLLSAMYCADRVIYRPFLRRSPDSPSAEAVPDKYICT